MLPTSSEPIYYDITNIVKHYDVPSLTLSSQDLYCDTHWGHLPTVKRDQQVMHVKPWLQLNFQSSNMAIYSQTKQFSLRLPWENIYWVSWVITRNWTSLLASLVHNLREGSLEVRASYKWVSCWNPVLRRLLGKQHMGSMEGYVTVVNVGEQKPVQLPQVRNKPVWIPLIQQPAGLTLKRTNFCFYVHYVSINSMKLPCVEHSAQSVHYNCFNIWGL